MNDIDLPKYKTPTEPIISRHPTIGMLHEDFTEMLTTDSSRIFTVLLSRAEVVLLREVLSDTIHEEVVLPKAEKAKE